MKKIYYWSPCLNPVGTVKSTLNSAISLSKYSKFYKVKIINVFGEWSNYENELKHYSIELINLSFNYYKYLPKTGYIQSRFSYIVIFLFSFFNLFFLLKKEKPDFLVMHLITSLPLTQMFFFKDIKFILRISGYPKLNFFRKFFWKFCSKKIYKVTCPTIELKSSLENNKLFNIEKIYYLPDAIIDIEKFKYQKFKKNIFMPPGNKKIILATGRLTKQKNFIYLIDEFEKLLQINDDFILYILGDGEEKKNLLRHIINKRLANSVFLIGHVENVYSYMQIADLFVLSSLWEEVGFVIVEAALSNLFIISSDCPNGPREFLNHGLNGILYNSNETGALFESFKKFLNEKNFFRMKVNAKKNSLKYTRFRHYSILKKILN